MSDNQHNHEANEQVRTPSAAPKPSWRDPLSPTREAELQSILNAWNAPDAQHGKRRGPFDSSALTSSGLSPEEYIRLLLSGADVAWLAEQSGRGEFGAVPNLHLEGANCPLADLEGIDLQSAHLEGASLIGAQLQGANLDDAHLRSANLSVANLEKTRLRNVDLRGADLSSAKLTGAYLREAHLEDASLAGAYLQGTNLVNTNMTGADLRGVTFDQDSILNSAILTGASFDQIRFGTTNLIVVDWSLVTTVGDAYTARTRKDANGKPKKRDKRLEEFKAAVRANRVLSVNLEAQGLAEYGDRFARQAQELQRPVYRLQRNLPAYLWSWVLNLLTGYGYRIWNIFIVYAILVLIFTGVYLLTGGIHDPSQGHPTMQQQFFDALQVSLNAIHGRWFFTNLGLDTALSWWATVESIVGIFIEGVFVAMLIQKFFSR